MRLLSALSWTSLAAAAALLVFDVVNWQGVDNPLNWFNLLYVLPPLAVGLLLKSTRRELQVIAGLLALAIGGFCAASVVVAITSGLSNEGTPILWAMLLPAAALYLVIFWAAVLRHPRRPIPLSHA